MNTKAEYTPLGSFLASKPPQIRNPFLAENVVRKGGARGIPIFLTYFFDKNQGFFEQKTQSLALL